MNVSPCGESYWDVTPLRLPEARDDSMLASEDRGEA